MPIDIQQYEDEIVGISASVVMSIFGYGIYQYLGGKKPIEQKRRSVKQQINKKQEQNLKELLMTPQFREDLFILGKIRINHYLEQITPEDCIRIYRMVRKHYCLLNQKTGTLQENASKRLEILRELQKKSKSGWMYYNEKYREQALSESAGDNNNNEQEILNIVLEQLDLDYNFMVENNIQDIPQWFWENFSHYYSQEHEYAGFKRDHDETLKHFGGLDLQIEYGNELTIKNLPKNKLIEIFIVEEKMKRDNFKKCARLRQTEFESESVVFRQFQKDYKILKYGISEADYRNLCEQYQLENDPIVQKELIKTENVEIELNRQANVKAQREW